MRLKNIKGTLVRKNVSKYLINWDKTSRSKVQFKVKKFLERYWKGCIVYEEFPVYGTLLKVDFLNATKKIAIEVQGKQHNQYIKYFHRHKLRFIDSLGRDLQKKEWLKLNEFHFIEIDEDEANGPLSLTFFREKFGISIF